MIYKSILLRFSLFLGFLFCAGCAGKSSYIQQDLWKLAPPFKSKDFHLVLLWKEKQQEIHDLQLAHPEQFVQLLAGECLKAGKVMRSYQVIESVEELYSWVPAWRPEIPVLYADASLNLQGSTETWKAEFQVRANFQPFLFDLAPYGQPISSVYSKKLTAADIPDLEDLATWFYEMEPQLYREMSSKLVSQSNTFNKKGTLVFFYEGKNQQMKAAYQTALSGDWLKAKQLYLEQLERDKNDPLLYLNLSAVSQMLGEWEQALEYYEKFSFVRPQGFVWLFSGLPLESYYTPMLKGMALTFKYKKAKQKYAPNSKLAILLFDNYTNDLDFPDQMRGALYAEALKLGYRVVPLSDVQEKLRVAGFTDGGQFGATTPQALGKIVGADLLLFGVQESISKSALKLVDAASGETVFEKRVTGIGNVDHVSKEYSKEKLKEYDTIRRERKKRGEPMEIDFPKFREVAAQKFFRPWPRSARF